MLTAAQGTSEIAAPKRFAPALSKLLTAAIILVPLAAMLFPELNHRSGNRAANGLQNASTVQSSAAKPLLVPCTVRGTGR